MSLELESCRRMGDFCGLDRWCAGFGWGKDIVR
mgnify:CR=1 FL=1